MSMLAPVSGRKTVWTGKKCAWSDANSYNYCYKHGASSGEGEMLDPPTLGSPLCNCMTKFVFF